MQKAECGLRNEKKAQEQPAFAQRYGGQAGTKKIWNENVKSRESRVTTNDLEGK
jgi:hypothetical protein